VKRCTRPPEGDVLGSVSSNARLVLEDGAVFEGRAFGAAASAAGEIVFNTGMTGYPEALTDPSYRGQILVLTYPLAGNYGVPGYELDEFGLRKHFESDSLHLSGLVVSEACSACSHHSATMSLSRWLEAEGVPGIEAVDTRAITRRLRGSGVMPGKIVSGDSDPAFFDPNTTDLVSAVTCGGISRMKPLDGDCPVVVLVDCGCKNGIVRSLLSRGLEVVRVPSTSYFLDLDFDGLVVSNGPGDPSMCQAAARNVERALALGRPILGICLGHQLLALAAGAETTKLRFGHRGQNQPCVLEPGGSRCFMTSQNHGYAVREETLPAEWRVWFRNLNDNTVEGIRHLTRPFMGVQFHPEGRPGPPDTSWVFDEFDSRVRSRHT
jgi:carbamoyl-phosphate synthase small subunit